MYYRKVLVFIFIFSSTTFVYAKCTDQEIGKYFHIKMNLLQSEKQYISAHDDLETAYADMKSCGAFNPELRDSSRCISDEEVTRIEKIEKLAEQKKSKNKSNFKLVKKCAEVSSFSLSLKKDLSEKIKKLKGDVKYYKNSYKKSSKNLHISQTNHYTCEQKIKKFIQLRESSFSSKIANWLRKVKAPDRTPASIPTPKIDDGIINNSKGGHGK